MKKIFFLFAIVNAALHLTAQNTGINNTNPQAALDINGDLIIRNAALTLANGLNEDINTITPKFSHYTVSGPTAGFEIGGLTGGVDGRMITLYNSSAFLMVIKHQSAGSLAANQIHTGSGVDFTLSSYSSVSFRYQDVDDLWHVVASHNEWVTGSSGSFWTAGGNDIFNSNTGNVGIGTTTPVHGRLEITGRVGATVALFGSDAFGVGISANNPEIGFNYFYNNGTYTMKAGYGANLGMDPGNGNFYIGNFNGNQSVTDFGPITGYQNVLTISQGGRVGIKNTSPAYELDITGQQRIKGTPITSPGFAGDITGGGSLFISNNNNDRKIMKVSATTIQASESFQFTSGSFAIPLYINPYGGGVCIGTTNLAGYQLAVNGNIRSKEVVVESGWADYVFDEKYKLPLLSDVEKFITRNRHLPNIPSALEIEKNGLHLGDVQKKMMEKIEELTLYIIEQHKRIAVLEKLVGPEK
jgi:hypothetical protein